MMLQFLPNKLSLLLIVLFLFGTACKKEEVLEEVQVTETTNQDTDDTAISLEGELQISDFVWEGLNTYYYWQEDVPNLADSKTSDEKAYAQFISENTEPEAFFQSLLHENDRFSWIQDDYEELENLLQGIYATNGVEFGLTLACSNCDEVVGYVKYILEGSDADGKNIQRGDFFSGVNGITLTRNNYRELLLSDELTYTLNMANVEGGAIVTNGVDVELTKEENFETNPVQVYKTIETSVGKMGYIMYNQFVGEKSPELNQVFGDLKSQGITELILDLRYNGGGSVRNCIELASMITGQFNNEVFSKEQWNSKLEAFLIERYGEESLTDRFVDKLAENDEAINSLNLNRVVIIATSDSASASELLINSLSPYIEVTHVGEQTVGKNVGSITVYDYIDNDRTKNPDHKYAMQPIVLKIANKEDYADYADGLEPDNPIEEDITNMGILGNPDEPLLASAINALTGTGKRSIAKPAHSRDLLIQDPLLLKIKGMHLDKSLFNDQGKR
jgi:C-terminal processing protease CtpA/Prc